VREGVPELGIVENPELYFGVRCANENEINRRITP
jgi:hypothetical protein